jgi:hypothetical protein
VSGAAELLLILEGGEPAFLSAEGVSLPLDDGYGVPGTVEFDAEYEITSPNPLFVENAS